MEVIKEQAMHALYDALNTIAFLKIKLETVPQICRGIGDLEMSEQMHSMIHYMEYLVKELDEQTAKAEKCYFRIREQENGTEA